MVDILQESNVFIESPSAAEAQARWEQNYNVKYGFWDRYGAQFKFSMNSPTIDGELYDKIRGHKNGKLITADEANKIYPTERPYTSDVDEGDARYWNERYNNQQARQTIIGDSKGMMDAIGLFATGVAGGIAGAPVSNAAMAAVSTAFPIAGLFKAGAIGERVLGANIAGYLASQKLISQMVLNGVENAAQAIPLEIATQSLAQGNYREYTNENYWDNIRNAALFGAGITAASRATTKAINYFTMGKKKGLTPIQTSRDLGDAALAKEAGINITPEEKFEARKTDVHRIRSYQYAQLSEDLDTMAKRKGTPEGISPLSDELMYIGAKSYDGEVIYGQQKIDGDFGTGVYLVSDQNKAFNSATGAFDGDNGTVITMKLGTGLKLFDITKPIPPDILDKLKPVLGAELYDDLKADVGTSLKDVLEGTSTRMEIAIDEDAVASTFHESGYAGYQWRNEGVENPHNAVMLFDKDYGKVVNASDAVLDESQLAENQAFATKFYADKADPIEMRKAAISEIVTREELAEFDEIPERIEQTELDKEVQNRIADIKEDYAGTPIVEEINGEATPETAREMTKALIVCLRKP